MARLHARLILAVALAFGLGASTAEAAPIDYGDFDGLTVMYLDVTESANAPTDAEPLFGPPTVVGDALDFEPESFQAASTSASSQLTDGQLNFDVMGKGAAVNSLSLSETGEYSLTGAVGSAATNVRYAISLASIKVLAIDGIDLGAAVDLAGAVVSSSKNLASDGPGTFDWSLSLSYDVDAALANAGLSFEFGATKLRIALDDTLTASSELIFVDLGPGSFDQIETAASIAKQTFVIDGGTTPIPAPGPSALALLLAAACGTGAIRRRRCS